MGKTIIYDKLQEVVIGAFGKDSSGISADDVMARINANAVEEVTNDDNVDNDIDNNDTNATNDNTVNNVNNDSNDNNDNNDDTDTLVDDVVDNDDNDSVDNNNNGIELSELFKAHFDIIEFDEDKILDKIKTLEDEKTALILEKEKLQRDTFIKEKGITKEVFEALSGTTLKEKEEALKKVSKLSGFKLNSTNDLKTKEIKFNSAF